MKTTLAHTCSFNKILNVIPVTIIDLDNIMKDAPGHTVNFHAELSTFLAKPSPALLIQFIRLPKCC